MFASYGLYSHIQANRLRSMFLLVGFVLLLQALTYSLLLITIALNSSAYASLGQILARTNQQFLPIWPWAMAAALSWFAVAYFVNSSLINMATGARGVTRKEAPKLYNALENLCISRGLPMPKLQIIENPALNAFASGLTESQYAVTVTRGLLEALNEQELEAVLAHELTHIRNRDTQLLVIAVIFAGIFAFFGDMFIGRWDFPYGWGPRDRRHSESGGGGWSTTSGGSGDGSGSDRRSDKDGGGGGAWIVAIAIAIAVILITWGISTLIRFALSRSREYLADAGAVELTKNPDAMISALRKIDQGAVMEVPTRMEAFFIENPVKERVTGFLSTHPAIEERIQALVAYAGGRDTGLAPARK